MILLPKPFEEILKSDISGSYIGAVNTTRSKFNQIFSENQLYFFEEYTDHGIRHINSVLASCSQLIISDTYKLLSEKDIAILVLGIFLHDLAMHLQPLTFKKIITGGYNDDALNADFGDEKWPVLWKNYLFEAKKFNDTQREKIFGDVDVHIIEPNLDNPDSLTGIDKKLIGEFIRRHHPRIAYEIAFKGLATHDGKQLLFCNDFDNDHIKLAALLARSHGMHLRNTFGFLDKHFGRAWKKPLDIHIIYLMAVLRLGDYFQIDSKRVLKIPYLTKQFRSPVSFSEHQKHLNTKYAQQLLDDPETLFITAEPGNSTYFLALENLFNDIQKEIDNAWAVLGEIYGLQRYDQQPKLTFRRIRSNLENKKLFESQVSYVPEEVSFIVDKEIPKLLVSPLYDYEPTYGIRELLQNSVDACLEREFYEQRKGCIYEGSINIKIEFIKDHYQCTITDNGKGMTLDEIKNYFLKVGGSFRKSLKWQTDHVDEDGHSNINKSGRFGIGVLAAYLLGSEIEIETKSISSPVGYRFKTTLEQEQIEVLKGPEITEGTTIRIHISDEIANKLTRPFHSKSEDDEFFDHIRLDQWYVLQTPQIKYKIADVQSSETGYKEYFPGLKDVLTNRWNEIYDHDFKRIIWSYDSIFNTLICNGFIVENNYDLESKHIYFKPALLIFDFDAKLPLNLNRTAVHDPLPFSRKLAEDIYKDVLAMLLCVKTENPFRDDFIYIKQYILQHPTRDNFRFYGDAKHAFNDLYTLTFFRDGYTLNHPIFLNQLEGLNYLRLFQRINFGDKLFNNKNINKIAKSDVDVVSLMTFDSKVMDKALDMMIKGLIYNYNMIGLTENFQQKLNKKAQLPINFEKALHDEFLKRWKLPANTAGMYYKIKSQPFEPDLLTTIIADLLGEDLIIPYNFEDRKKKFPNAFEALERYMRKYLE